MSVDLLTPPEIKAARLALGLSVRGMARIIGLSDGNGNDRVLDWEGGRFPISGPASQCIRLWLAVEGLGRTPMIPEDLRVGRKIPGQK